MLRGTMGEYRLSIEFMNTMNHKDGLITLSAYSEITLTLFVVANG